MRPRRRSGVRWLLTGLGATVAAALAYAHLVEPRRLVVERWTVRIPELPAAWEGLRIVQLSDFQIGMWGERRDLPRRAVARALALRPDLAFLTGDFVDAGRWVQRADIFRPLAARVPVYAVLGNHDHQHSDADSAAIVAALRDQGVTVLMNEHVPFTRAAHTWEIVGIDDLATNHSDLLAAIIGIPRNRRLLALLTHVPEGADYAPPGWFPLTVAGHTHGGQVWLAPLRRLPLLRHAWRLLDGKYPRGWFAVNGGLLYVNRGLGLSTLPLRFGAPPEVTLFVLTDGRALADGERWRKDDHSRGSGSHSP